MDWTEDQISRLRKLWTDGMSAASIGDAMGLSKNSIVGKAHRLGLAGRRSPIHRSGEPRPARPPRIKREKMAEVIALPPRPEPQAVERALITPPVAAPLPAIAAARPAPPRKPAPHVCLDAPRIARGTCVFPMWGTEAPPNPAVFCDAPATYKGYCETHASRCFDPAARRREGARLQARYGA